MGQRSDSPSRVQKRGMDSTSDTEIQFLISLKEGVGGKPQKTSERNGRSGQFSSGLSPTFWKIYLEHILGGLLAIFLNIYFRDQLYCMWDC